MGLLDRLAMLGISRGEVKAELTVLIVEILADMERQKQIELVSKREYGEWLKKELGTVKTK